MQRLSEVPARPYREVNAGLPNRVEPHTHALEQMTGRNEALLLHPDPDLVETGDIGRTVGPGVHRGIGGEVIDQRLEVHQQICRMPTSLEMKKTPAFGTVVVRPLRPIHHEFGSA